MVGFQVFKLKFEFIPKQGQSHERYIGITRIDFRQLSVLFSFIFIKVSSHFILQSFYSENWYVAVFETLHHKLLP